jgi:hypothetical protein
MAGQVATQGGITHRGWRKDMESAVMIVNTILHELEVMEAALIKVEAGRTQLALVRRDIAVGTALKSALQQFIGKTNTRYIPVGETVAQVGGLPEVALEKRYHTVG